MAWILWIESMAILDMLKRMGETESLSPSFVAWLGDKQVSECDLLLNINIGGRKI